MQAQSGTSASAALSSGANLTVSLHRRYGPLTAWAYGSVHGDEVESHVRLIVTLTAALTVLFLVLPAHP
jgi:hypothetical protein